MTDSVIQVENLSKCYRIGAREEANKTFREAVVDAFRAPMRNFIRLRELTKFEAKRPDGTDGSTTIHNKDIIWALKDVSFKVKEGEVLGIIGRNGAGKSTLLKILAQITEPTGGDVKLYGRVSSLLEVGTGFHPELTGRENIFLNGALLGMRKGEIAKKFDEIVSFAEIEKFIDTPVKRYSSGMYVRLAFAVAAHLEPEILIVDEVLAVGDVQFQKKCLGKMESVGKEGRTILFVSHNMGAINRLCSHCIQLHQGELVANGPTANAIRAYLSMHTVGTSIYEQLHDGKKAMNLRKVVLNPQNDQESSEVPYDRAIRVRIEYEVNQNVSNCTVWLALQTDEGINAFTTADYDQNIEMLKRRTPGYYRTDVHIPGQWLNAGRYTIVVGIVMNRPLEIYDRVEAITFTVIDVGTPSSLLEVGTRRGVLQPVLQWDQEKVE
jgi:lipopolysaccharide transport system ATP-binding protein